MAMHGPFISLLEGAYRARFPGPVPPAHELVWLPFVGPFLQHIDEFSTRLHRALLELATESESLCVCGHAADEHPLDGTCASCGCLGYVALPPRPAALSPSPFHPSAATSHGSSALGSPGEEAV